MSLKWRETTSHSLSPFHSIVTHHPFMGAGEKFHLLIKIQSKGIFPFLKSSFKISFDIAESKSDNCVSNKSIDLNSISLDATIHFERSDKYTCSTWIKVRVRFLPRGKNNCEKPMENCFTRLSMLTTSNVARDWALESCAGKLSIEL